MSDQPKRPTPQDLGWRPIRGRELLEPTRVDSLVRSHRDAQMDCDTDRMARLEGNLADLGWELAPEAADAIWTTVRERQMLQEAAADRWNAANLPSAGRVMQALGRALPPPIDYEAEQAAKRRKIDADAARIARGMDSGRRAR